MSSNEEDKPPPENSDGAIGGQEEDKQGEDGPSLGFLQQLLAKFKLQSSDETLPEKEKPEQLLENVTFEGVANYIKKGQCKNIIVMTGAGISTAAGIPDFRSPGTGLYDNLQKYDLPRPQAVFEISFFRSNPEPFFTLAKELYPGKFKPTITHYFIKFLNDKGLLLRNYTQNIDTLERVAGLPEEKLVEAHGSFHTAHCLGCRKEYTHEWVKDEVFADKVPECPDCGGVVKPDIVFFGESLPDVFHKCLPQDMPKCDLLIVMGTSLVVQPFASLVDRVPETTPRLLINKEKCGNQPDFFRLLMGGSSGFQFDSEDNYRDVMWQGTTDDGCIALADFLGWKDELLKYVETEHKRIDEASAKEQESQSTGEKKGADKSTSKDSETEKPDKDSSNL
ncbi:NAD-dependent protein deacetylase sirtuin-2-like isoform X1 [Oculina patagonica]